MTNGIAVSLSDAYGRDYWHNGTACSGYSFKGEPTGHCLRAFKFGVGKLPAAFGWDSKTFDDFSPYYKLAVPERLVWWQDE